MPVMGCQVEVAVADAEVFAVGQTLTAEAAWKSGLDATAQWRVHGVEHRKKYGAMIVIVTLQREAS